MSININIRIAAAMLMCGMGMTSNAQTVATNALQANPKANVMVPFKYDDAGVKLPDVEWGLDQAWLWDDIMNRSLLYTGKDIIDIVRLSFRVNEALANGTDLTNEMKSFLDQRIANARLAGENVKMAINTDQEAGINDWYHGTYNRKFSLSGYTYSIKTYLDPARWVNNIKAHIQYIEADGKNRVVSIAPFNEPDYGWKQGTLSDPNTKNMNNATETKKEMKSICDALKADAFFNGRRISGGNTLNCSEAKSWYDYLGSSIDEGNTHQLAGTMADYTSFFTQVKNDGKHPTADELHNIMEAFVGVEYGMKTGIWWGHAERARADIMRATRGTRLGYAEDPANWMAACVYRNPDGQVQAFIGQSERQATSTSFSFRSDKGVYYEGQGPLREFNVSVTGGTGYQEGTTNGERVYEVHGGDDVPYHIEGNYYLASRRGCITAGGGNGDALTVAPCTGSATQQWSFTQFADTKGGDYSYYEVKNVGNGAAIDIINWSLTEGDRFIQYDWAGGNNQTYWIEYAGDGYYYIRCRQSAMCLTASGSGVVQMPLQRGNTSQQWRFIPANVTPEFDAPAQPRNLTAQGQGASIRIDWQAGATDDATLDGFVVLRSTDANSGYETIARNVRGTAFVDHDIVEGQTYYYKVKAIDTSLNSSAACEPASAQMQQGKHLVAYLTMDNTLDDNTENMNNATTIANATYTAGHEGEALTLDGTSQFAQLPYDIAKTSAMTFAAWVRWDGGNGWQRIFDFGNDESHYMFLTPSGDSNLAFGIKNGGAETRVTTSALTAGQWTHVAVTISDAGKVTLYVNGQEKASATPGITPADVAPTFNYIGRSQFNADPLMKGAIDEVRLYNYDLNADEVETLYNGLSVSEVSVTLNISKAEWATLMLPFDYAVPKGITAYACSDWKDVDNNHSNLTLTESTTFEAYKPYLVYGDYTVADETKPVLAPAHTGASRVEVKRESYTFTGLVVEQQETTFTDGLFTGTTVAMNAPVDSYVLQNQPTTYGVAFYRVPEGKVVPVGAYRCYLNPPTGQSNVRAFTFVKADDDATGIATIQQANENAPYYTLDGRRIEGKPRSGLYIQNGRKVLMK